MTIYFPGKLIPRSYFHKRTELFLPKDFGSLPVLLASTRCLQKEQVLMTCNETACVQQ